MKTEQYHRALGLFEKQIDCLIRDDKDAQMGLYTGDLLYEFPFARDQPRLIEGPKRFRTAIDIGVGLYPVNQFFSKYFELKPVESTEL
jgi:hypothetical protein